MARQYQYDLATITERESRGQSYEELGKELIESALGVKCVKATKSEDFYQHKDYKWEIDGEEVSIDFKAPKKRWNPQTKRKDYAYDQCVLESINQYGNRGSLYGKATYMGFFTDKDLIVVRREKLPPYLEPLIEGKPTLRKSDELYQPLTRNGILHPDGRPYLDKFTWVPISDMLNLAEFSINIENKKLTLYNT